MKKVIIPGDDTTTTTPDRVSTKKVYAAIITGASISLIVKSNYNSDKFVTNRLDSAEGITMCDAYSAFQGETIREVVEKLLRYKHSVYEFDTAREFFEWAAERCR